MVSSLTKMYILYWLTLFFPANLHIFIRIKHNQTSISFWIQGKMAHISVPKKLEKQFRPSLTRGSVYMFANIIAVDTKQKAYIYQQNKRHIYITIRTTCSSSNTPRRLIVFKHEEEPSPDLHSIYAHLINFHQKTSAQNPS